jgi:hypothetical protein
MATKTYEVPKKTADLQEFPQFVGRVAGIPALLQ